METTTLRKEHIKLMNEGFDMCLGDTLACLDLHVLEFAVEGFPSLSGK
jgi:hypothetical protein